MNNIIFGIIGITYRCNAKCYMCNTWKFPSKKEDEIDFKTISKFPQVGVINVTGGEPFLREDLPEIIQILRNKAKRIVISTNGFYYDRIIKFAKNNPNIGIRISLEGLQKSNDELRGINGGFETGIKTLTELNYMGLKDIGFGMTVSDRNAKDLVDLYKLSKSLKMEFATATLHNSYYFHKMDNKIEDKEMVSGEFKKLIYELFKSKRPKDWFRAYFNYGIINFINGNPRLLPCEMGINSFFLDPFGEIRPCNAMEESMGNLKEKSFEEIWNGTEAKQIREKVKICDKNCWMIGSVSEMMKKNIFKPTFWIFKTKFLGRPVC